MIDSGTDLYELLGVARTATDDELKRAYRKKAREHHPDANGGDPEAEERFKEVSLAYEILSDPERRARYDQFGMAGVMPGAQGGGGGFGGDAFTGGLGDLFDAFFNGGFGGMGGMGGRTRRAGPAPGPDAEMTIRLAFRESVFGVQREISVNTPVHCDTCEGSGARPGTTPVRCSECDGTGEIRRVRQSILGQVVMSSPCGRCQGTGEMITTPCADCQGAGRLVKERTLTVDVPAGVDTGATLRLAGHGSAGFRGGPSGSLYVHLAVADDPVFTREGDDLHADLHVAMTQAALGAQVAFETLESTEQITVPAGTQSGHVVRLRHQGVPHLRGRGRGDLYVHVIVDTPTGLDAEQRAALEQLAGMRGEDVAARGGDGLFSKLRSAIS